MTPIRINDKPYECPSCWEELKTRQYVRILKEWEPEKDIADRDYFKLLSILTDSNYATMDPTIENQVTLTNLLGWVITQPFKLKQELPKVLRIGDKVIDIPRDPSELSIGQNIHLRRDFIDKSTILEENMSIATAIYLQPMIDNSKFNLSRAKEIAKEVDEMPIYMIYPVGFFLLIRASKFGLPPKRNWLQVPISQARKLSRLLRRWQRSIF